MDNKPPRGGDTPEANSPKSRTSAEHRDSPPATISAEHKSTLDIARRFLTSDDVKNTSREQKTEFLKSKGLRSEDIDSLL